MVANAKDFGASGDGTTDDTKALQDAINAMGEGALLIPKGRYHLTGQLVIRKPGVVLRGATAGSCAWPPRPGHHDELGFNPLAFEGALNCWALDIVVRNCVARQGTGGEINLDHHSRTPFENLYSDIHLGRGEYPWFPIDWVGATDIRAGARSTIWNVRRADGPVPPPSWAHTQVNVIGTTETRPLRNGNGWRPCPPCSRPTCIRADFPEP